jgi:Tol biopolymer transport system component
MNNPSAIVSAMTHSHSFRRGWNRFPPHRAVLVITAVLLISLPPAGSAADVVSVRGPLPIATAASGSSSAPRVSADGRFVLFTSSANDLTLGDNGYLSLDVFLRDRASNATYLVSANLSGTGGGNDHSMYGGVSTNGRYVVFESAATDLVAGDTNTNNDIFVRDLLLGTTTLVSVGIGGQPANGASSEAVMTPDGRYVAFISSASNLVAGDTNRIDDVFVRDLVAGTTRLVSVGATQVGAVMGSPVITPDGRYVAFFSTARGLVAAVPTSSQGEIYLCDLVSQTTTWASITAAVLASSYLGLANPPSTHPALSDDGRFVAFKTGWTNGLVAPPAPGQAAAMVFIFDTTTATDTIVATNGFPPWVQNDDVYGPEMTPDGRFVAFGQEEVINGVTNASLQLWDSLAGSNTLVSVNLNGQVSSNSLSHSPALSPDGRFVAFVSNATNLVSNVVSNGFHIYLRDMQSNTTFLVDADTNGIGSTDFEGAVPSLTADGTFVAFSGLDGKLVATDNNKALDVFLRNTTNSTTELVSQRNPAVNTISGNGVSLYSQFSLSDDGRRITFVSHASDLVPNDTNATMDVFVRDLVTASNLLVSIGTNGSARPGGSSSPVISGDGRFVAFVSTATNVAPLPSFASSQLANIYLWDLQTRSNILVTLNASRTQSGNSDSSSPRISQDGRYIAYSTIASNLGGPAGVYRYDASLRTNVYLPSSVTNLPPSMSRDGRFVAYPLSSQQVRVRDILNGTDVYTSPGVMTSAALSPQGTRLLYRTTNSLVVADLNFNSNIISFVSSVPVQGPCQWSTNDRLFAFVTASNAVPSGLPADSNGTNDVYLYDLAGRTLRLVSFNASRTNSGNGPSDSPALSGDGRFVAFRSFATDIVPGISNTPNIFLYDRLTGSNTLVTSTVGLRGWTSWASKPVLSANGGTVTFQSWSFGLVTNDLNRVQDIFVAVVAAGVDSDGDGIPDAWMIQHFGHPTGQAGDHSRAQDDADGDGMSNLQEYLAGTDPLNPNSVFKTALTLVVATNGAVLQWPAALGKAYRVQYKDDLSDPQWVDAPGTVSVNGNLGSYSESRVSPRRYYRVTVFP